MPKTYKQDAEQRAAFLSPVAVDHDRDETGERSSMSALRGAKFIEIQRIKPDPNQPRKVFDKEKLESLAESIRELGEIIDPITVEYREKEGFFRIISGERRYRAAKSVGLEKLPCIIKTVDEKRRLLLQLIANLQREAISPLEESAGIKNLMAKFGYSQIEVARLLNKSKSYISQIMGLERLSETAREIVQTSELSKEVQIMASREKDPQKQLDLLNEASETGKTVRQIRKEEHLTEASGKKPRPAQKNHEFKEWRWQPKDGRFILTIRFSHEQKEQEKIDLVRDSLEEALSYLGS
ncbi:MAG: ParB/RepB/Spo0J family partition protein [Desulfatiglandaceae bacterium]